MMKRSIGFVLIACLLAGCSIAEQNEQWCSCSEDDGKEHRSGTELTENGEPSICLPVAYMLGSGHSCAWVNPESR